MAKWEIDVPPEQAEEEYDIDYFIKDGQQGLLSLKFDDNEIMKTVLSWIRYIEMGTSFELFDE